MLQLKWQRRQSYWPAPPAGGGSTPGHAQSGGQSAPAQCIMCGVKKHLKSQSKGLGQKMNQSAPPAGGGSMPSHAQSGGQSVPAVNHSAKGAKACEVIHAPLLASDQR